MIIDTVAEYGLVKMCEIEYKGNFTINYHSKEDLKLLQDFFGVRRSKFDMKLLDKRLHLLERLLHEYSDS